MAERVTSYEPPTWATSLKTIPTDIVKLATTPTPIQKWKLPGAPDNFEVLIKRDDLTGYTLSGNKVRKLEFLLADALKKSARHIVTAGYLHSNHCRAVAAACAELGLQCHLIVLTDSQDVSKLTIDGNLFTAKLCGAHIHLMDKTLPYHTHTHTKPAVDRLIQQIEKETGENAYYVPMAGYGILGLWGYIECFEELRNQGIEFDDIVGVSGSGHTLFGLALANHLCGSPYKIHCMRNNGFLGGGVLNDRLLDQLELTDIRSADILQEYYEYIGPGYDISQPHELEFLANTAEQTGVLLDSCYTVKAAYGPSDLLQKRPEVFKGKRVLFLHSGGATALHSEVNREAILPYLTKGRVSVIPPL